LPSWPINIKSKDFTKTLKYIPTEFLIYPPLVSDYCG
jgi:hypothetical protein